MWRDRARFCIFQRKEEHRSAPLLSKTVRVSANLLLRSFLPGRRLDVHIYLLCATAPKQPTSKRKQHYQNDDHEDHQHCDNSRAAATTTVTVTIVSHEVNPPVAGEQLISRRGFRELIVTISPGNRQSSKRKNQGRQEPILSPSGLSMSYVRPVNLYRVYGHDVWALVQILLRV
jgi:hypothetical protein